MLSVLSIRDIVLIDRAELHFETGLCVLTGETGAGKSILLDALGLAIGARADKRLVRHGAGEGAVTASFVVPPEHPVFTLLHEHGIQNPGDEPGLVLLRRIVGLEIPSRAFINDQPVGVGLLQKVGASLLEIHGQHDDRGLLDPAAHRAVLDVYGGLEQDARGVAEAFAVWRRAEEAWQERDERIARARGEADYLAHVLKELNDLDPQPDEEDTLAAERTLLMHAEKIAGDLELAAKALMGEGGMETKLNTALRRLEKVREQAAGRLDEVIGALDRTLTEIGEARHAIDSAMSDFDFNADRLSHAEERLFALRAAARKHGVQVHQLPELRERFHAELSSIETGEADLAALRKATEEARQFYIKRARALSEKRKAAATKLDTEIETELRPLKLDKAHVRTNVIALEEDKGGAGGLDQVRFEVATNPGAPFGPLTQIASGGELSRFILALKVVLAAQGAARTLIFDEIDRGVGGAVADAVGERLSRLAAGASGQILVVTHSPQVAARGRHHWRIAKGQDGAGGTAAAFVTRVERLDEADRREEIARMLAGATVTDEARAAAARLIGSGETDKPQQKRRAKRA